LDDLSIVYHLSKNELEALDAGKTGNDAKGEFEAVPMIELEDDGDQKVNNR
jgi:hypothetical protein